MLAGEEAEGVDPDQRLDATDPLADRGLANQLDQAELAGSITGWESLPAPATDHFLAAIVSYTQGRELGADDNTLPPPPVAGPIAANVCARAGTGPAPACA